MGSVSRGIPRSITVELARLAGATAFVETGTFFGGTTRWAAEHFETVHTIERAQVLYDRHSAGLRALKGVHPHLGNSREVLPGVIASLRDGQRAVHWLDGHWTGGETAGEDEECPLLAELAAIAHRPDDIILIDDARLVLSAPPMHHDPTHWPTIAEIVDALPPASPKHFVQVIDDVIFAIPNKPELRTRLVDYARERAMVEIKQRMTLPKRVVSKSKRILLKIRRAMANA